MNQNRLLAILLSVLAVLVLAIGGLSAILLLGGDDNGGGATAGSGVTTGGSGGGSAGGDLTQPASGRLRLASTE